MAQWIKDLVVSLQQLRSEMGAGVQCLAWELLHAMGTAEKKKMLRELRKIINKKCRSL